jgi:hypothetical protein
MTTTDPTRSPAGTESAWAYTHIPRDAGWDEETVARYADRIERTIERNAPGFRATVLARRVQGPRDLQAANPSLVDGAINGARSRCTNSSCSARSPGWAEPTPRSRTCSSRGPRRIPVGPCTARPARTQRALLAASGPTGVVYRAAVRCRSFHPDQWLDGSMREDRSLVPFSAGPAVCPGRELVLFTASTFLAVLLRDLEIGPSRELQGAPPLPRGLDPFALRLTARSRP